MNVKTVEHIKGGQAYKINVEQDKAWKPISINETFYKYPLHFATKQY